ncbi:histidine phosphatase family protein [Haloferax namakaokahaiae]|uniref:Histidine phosphatase family protein n=1 Tax=Haloferax namakaokahaiae TaxID=1748331 RepID=A0ABD5ZI67_9EURY
MATLLLARHGETTWNRAGRVQGWAPTSLTDRGQSQVEALAAHVASNYDIDRLIASDIERAQETARPLASELDIEPAFDPSWRERDFGSLQGLLSDELFTTYPQYALSQVGAPAARERPPSGESIVETQRRVLTALEGLSSSLEADETAVVVTHSGPIRLILGEVHGLDIQTSMLDLSVENASLFELSIELDEETETADYHVIAENETRHLPE